MTDLKIGDKVQLNPGGLKTETVPLNPNHPVGRVLRFPRPSTGNPPLATVGWDNGKTNIHDRRSLNVVA